MSETRDYTLPRPLYDFLKALPPDEEVPITVSIDGGPEVPLKRRDLVFHDDGRVEVTRGD